MTKHNHEDCPECEKAFEHFFEKLGDEIGDKKCHHKNWNDNHSGGAVYGLGFIGALIYFISHATTFWIGVLGILKAIVWPAYLVYEVLNYFL
jgi:hypothetical protein